MKYPNCPQTQQHSDSNYRSDYRCLQRDNMKILVGYDGTTICNNALKLAKKHAKAHNGEVIALTSLYVSDTVEVEEAEKALAIAEKIFSDGEVPFSYEVSARGMHSGEDIVSYAQEHAIDEIIIGVKKRSKVGKMLFGSTLQNVVLNAPCPVVTIK
jgi:nucleotide-binding universal stress UspA family protein